MITLKHAAKYETTPLRRILRENFGEANLFGGNSEQDTIHAAKIAVTATDEVGKRAIMLANYSRKDTTQNKRRKGYYDFPRPDNPDLELKVWEAAAATSAAPSFFKPFVHAPTNRTYLDGALYHNNPVKLVHRERKLLWPDVADKHPDILLSVGTSQNLSEVNKDLPTGPSASRSARRYLKQCSSILNFSNDSLDVPVSGKRIKKSQLDLYFLNYDKYSKQWYVPFVMFQVSQLADRL